MGAHVDTGLTQAIVEEQLEANRSSVGHWGSFAEHRRRLTTLVLDRAPPSGSGRLCVLGAGNGHDLDWEALLDRFASIHVVDLDGHALEQARLRLPASRRHRVIVRAPVDLSGLLGRLHEWRRGSLTPEEIAHWPRVETERIKLEIGERFDVVASTCLLTQMQRAVLHGLGSEHRLFKAARWTCCTCAHWRVC